MKAREKGQGKHQTIYIKTMNKYRETAEYLTRTDKKHPSLMLTSK